MKLGIIVDSCVGIMKEEIEAKGWYLLPLFFNIDGKEYRDGEDMDLPTFYDTINLESNLKTSSSSPGEIEKLFKKVSKEYDQVIVYGLTIGLSSQTNNLMMESKNFNNINIVPSLGVGSSIIHDVEYLETMNENGSSIEEIMKQAEIMTKSQIAFILPRNMDWLVKGGRANKAIASTAKLFNIVPIIKFIDGKIEIYKKGRSFNKSVTKIAHYIQDETEDNNEYIIYHASKEPDKELIKRIEEVIGRKLETRLLPVVIGAHTGPNTLVIMSYMKMQ